MPYYNPTNAVDLAALYTSTVTPTLVRQYAREVLEDACRRAVGLHGLRLMELAESTATGRELTDCVVPKYRQVRCGVFRVTTWIPYSYDQKRFGLQLYPLQQRQYHPLRGTVVNCSGHSLYG
ncbi:MAG: hypothetical protein QOC62_3248 [Mycobacterium sp.]|jgi:hypothetical protein|nr:hypothetical protein [Mycobacterium sp.]